MSAWHTLLSPETWEKSCLTVRRSPILQARQVDLAPEFCILESEV